MNPNRPLISVIIGTARESYGAYFRDPNLHLMLPTFQSLQDQTMQDFEVIIVDSLFKHRQLSCEIESLGTWNFKWKVVEPKSVWLERGLWGLQNAFNIGAVESRGSHLLFCGDCFRLPVYALEHSTVLIEQGYAPQLLCFRTKGCKLVRNDNIGMEVLQPFDPPCYTVQEAKDRNLFKPGSIYGDSRVAHLHEGFTHPLNFDWHWHFGYGFIRRDDFFSVNGWDELFDGDKALGDVEMGSRLEMCGRMKACLVWDLVVYEELHSVVSSLALWNYGNSFKSNYDLLWLMRLQNISRANSTIFKSEDLWRVVRAQITGLIGWSLRYGDLPKRERFYAEQWIAEQKRFILEDYCAGG